jgi:hypothetical protein
MGWIKFKIQKPKENKEVTVRFNNGKEIKGVRDGDCMVYSPKDIEFEDIMSEEKEWLLE